MGEHFHGLVSFSRSPVVAIDNLLDWHQASMPEVIRDLERNARLRNAKVILVLRDPKDLLKCGYNLMRAPRHIPLTSATFSATDLKRPPTVP